MLGDLEPLAALLIPLAFALSSITTRAVLEYARRAGIVDRPNFRSLHSVPTPRGGGLAIAAAFAVSALVLAARVPAAQGPLLALVCAASLITALGWVEDSRGLSVSTRLVFQFAVATLLLVFVGWPASAEVFGTTIRFGWLGVPIALLWLVWSTNLYNFMDGIDGLAGAQAVLAGSAYGLWFARAGAPALALLAWCTAAAAAGFLIWNWHPAKVFLGDAGSLMLGIVFGGLALVGVVQYDIPWSAFVLGLGIFIADATWTLLRRMARNERWWLPHRTHYFQRAVATGWSHSRVTTTVVAAGVALAALGTLEAARIEPRWSWLLMAAALVLALAVLVRIRELVLRDDAAPKPTDIVAEPVASDPAR